MDLFAEIAKSGIASERETLVVPQPVPFEEKPVMLDAGSFEPTRDLERISTEEELRKKLEKLRQEYKPFLQKHAPGFTATRTRMPLETFTWRQVGKEDSEKTVKLPHYGGPLGAATCIYETVFTYDVPADKELYLVIAGADYKARVFINDAFVGMHEGFFASFEFAVSRFLHGGGNTLRIELDNDYVMLGNSSEEDGTPRYGDKIYAATGPGYDDAARGWHHCPPGMGLFDKVWLEERNPVFVSDIFTRTLEDEMEVWAEVTSSSYIPQALRLQVSLFGENHEQTVFTERIIEPSTQSAIGLGDTYTEVLARRTNTLNAEKPLLCEKGRNLFKFRLSREELKNWEPDAPYLYQLQASVIDESGNVLDTKDSIFGVRTFTEEVLDGRKGMFCLNGRSIRLRGANTMGFEQQDVMHGDMEQLMDDILLAKLCNMNFWRLTQRPVQQEIYDMCDRLGLMVQTDLPLFGCLRRHQFCEALRQAEEMERHVRSHPSNIMVTYINEPMPNARNLPSMNLTRPEMEQFFAAADIVVRLNNPDRVIKHVDGDYDPPSTTLPDNHCYCMWYNGHGIDIGKLHKGYWLPVMPGWYYGCGEYGCEGLEDESLMRKAYPKDWLPQSEEEEEMWTPSRIVRAQTGDFYHFFYEQQHSVAKWIIESQKFQALATKMMTEAFRRDERMVTFAIHLFIDAFPSGWMKTIMDCERRPKPAYFEYRNALAPILLSLRTDRFAYSAGEELKAESWLCNDTHREGSYTVRYELFKGGVPVAEKDSSVTVREMGVDYTGTVTFPLESDGEERTEYTLRAFLRDGDSVITSNELSVTVLPHVEVKESDFAVKTAEQVTEDDRRMAEEGGILFINKPSMGEYTVFGEKIVVKESGMCPMHFASRDTGHAWVKGFAPDDFRHWYDSKEDMITPLAECTFTAPGFAPVLTSRNLEEGTWQREMLMGEMKVGKGRVILSMIDFARLAEHPVGRVLLRNMQDVSLL